MDKEAKVDQQLQNRNSGRAKTDVAMPGLKAR